MNDILLSNSQVSKGDLTVRVPYERNFEIYSDAPNSSSNIAPRILNSGEFLPNEYNREHFSTCGAENQSRMTNISSVISPSQIPSSKNENDDDTTKAFNGKKTRRRHPTLTLISSGGKINLVCESEDKWNRNNLATSKWVS